MTYGSETRPLPVDVGLKFERAEMQMIRWMCGISMKDRRTNEELRRLVGVEPITTFIRSGRLRWYVVGRNGEIPIFRTASSTTGGWSHWNILMCFLYHSEHYSLCFGP